MMTFATKQKAEYYRRKIKKLNSENTFRINYYFLDRKLVFEVIQTNRFSTESKS